MGMTPDIYKPIMEILNSNDVKFTAGVAPIGNSPLYLYSVDLKTKTKTGRITTKKDVFCIMHTPKQNQINVIIDNDTVFTCQYTSLRRPADSDNPDKYIADILNICKNKTNKQAAVKLTNLNKKFIAAAKLKHKTK